MRVAERLAATAVFLLAAGTAAQATELRVLNWQGYGTDEAWAVAGFKAETGADVVHDYFNSEQEMLTKLRTNPGYYDVVLINAIYNPQAAAEGLIQPIDKAKITHFADLQPSLRDSELVTGSGRLTGIAWLWGATSVAVNEDKVKPLPDSMNVLWDPEYAGKVGWRDDSLEAVQIAALALGQDMNRPSDLAAVRQKLLALKPQVRTFWSSEDEWNKLFQAGDYVVSVYWSGSAARSKKAFGLPVAFVVPKEGAIGWFDSLAIAKGAPHPDLAARFIDYMVSPEFYDRWDTTAGAPVSSNVKAVETLPADAVNRAVFGKPEFIRKLHFMRPVDDADRRKYLELWQDVKTQIAQ